MIRVSNAEICRQSPFHRLAVVMAVLLCAGVTKAQSSEDPPPPTQPPGGLFGVPLDEMSPNPAVPIPEGRSTRQERREIVRTTKTPTSNAVHAALDWLGKHQFADGSWSFLHTASPCCRGKCGNPGSLSEARNAATGLALLAYLGAGLTHQQGDCQKQVKAGLDYLKSHQEMTESGGTFQEGGGNMYSHGIATLALCEAYSLSGDKRLIPPAQKAIDYVVFAQDPVGGGWRYQPRQPGDTSVLGWQLSALRAAELADLNVPQDTFRRATAFLDSVQSETGFGYGYTQPGIGQATTAIGLLMRMYLQGEPKDASSKAGIAQIAASQPSRNDMYYNYYAAQVLEQAARRRCGKWRSTMREQLLSTQSHEGHEAGSWYFGGRHHASDRGGRLYDTATATLILEVYYRHLPIHRKDAVKRPLVSTESAGDER